MSAAWKRSLAAGLLPLILLLGALPAPAQSLDDLHRTHDARLQDALRRLSEVQSRVADEKLPLGAELNQVQGEARRLRSSLRGLMAARDSQQLGLEKLRERVDGRRREIDYVLSSLSGELANSFEASLSSGEMAVEGQLVRDLNALLSDPDASDEAKLEETLGLLEASTGRAEALVGGRRYPGSALDESDQLVQGRFLQVGPLLYFSDDSGSKAGWVEESQTLEPRVRALDPALGEQVAGAVRSGSGSLPVDASLGDALTVLETRETLGEHLEAGGVWVYPIVFFALVSTLVVIYKTIQMFLFVRRSSPGAAGRIVELLQEKKKDRALALARSQPYPGREVLETGIEHAEEPVEMVEEAVGETLLGIQPRLERFLTVIAVTAATAPLLGLLGTVTGIIKTFELMRIFGAGDPKPLIKGISEALITTELGLVLAIPALLIHALLSRKVHGIMAHLERVAVEFSNSLARSRTGLAATQKSMGREGGGD